MADVVRDILIRILGEDSTGPALSSFSSGLKDVNSSISSVTEPIAQLTEKMALAAAGAAALGVTFAGIAINEASKFSEKVEEIGSLVNATPADVDKLGSSIQELATSTSGANSSFEQIQDAVYNATSALGSASAAVDIMTVSSKGAEVGATDLNTSTTLLTGTLNAYGLVTSDSATNNTNAERVMAAMFTTVQNGVVNMQQLSDNMGKVSSTAAGAGVPIEQVGASIATLTGAGINAEQSFTKLNALILELTNPSKELSTALGGVSLEADGLPAVLDKLQTATGGSTTKFNELFGSSEAASAALVLSNDSAGKFDSTLNAMNSSVTNFNSNYEQMTGGVANSSQSLTNTIKSLFIDAGKPLQDDWQNILTGLTSVTNAADFALKDGAFDEIYDAFDTFSLTAVKFLEGVAQALPEALSQVNFQEFLDAFGSLGGAISGSLGEMDLTNPEDLAEAIQALVNGATNLTNYFAELSRTITPLVQDVLGFVTQGGEAGRTASEAAGRISGLSIEFNALSPLLSGITSVFGGLGTALTALAWTQTASGAAALASNIGGLSTALTIVNPGFLAVIATLGAAVAAFELARSAQETFAAETEALNESQLQQQFALEKTEEILARFNDSTGLSVQSTAEMQKAIDSGNASLDEATGKYRLTKQGADEYGATVGGVKLSSEELASEILNGNAIWDEQSQRYITAAEDTDRYSQAISDATDWNAVYADKAEEITRALGIVNDATNQTIETYADHAKAQQALLDITDAGHEGWITYADGLYVVTDAGESVVKSSDDAAKAVEDTAASNIRGSEEWARTASAMNEATKIANDFTIAAQEIAGKRYEAVVTAVVDLKVADIEAQTARIESAFESLNVGIESTGETLTGLVDSFVSLGTLGAGDAYEFIKGLIEDENARRQQEFDLQSKLVNAQVQYMEAQTARLTSGEALIQIDGTELVPSLELVLTDIVQLAHIKASEFANSFLIGIS